MFCPFCFPPALYCHRSKAQELIDRITAHHQQRKKQG